MRKIIAGLSAAGLCLGVALLPPAANAAPAAGSAGGSSPARAGAPGDRTLAAPASVRWKRCAKPMEKLECAEISVPADHSDPEGRRITIALTRKKHTVPTREYKGILLVNPGGPGAPGRALATIFEDTAAEKAAAAYDVIGFDPRGVGASRPRINCLPKRGKALPDTVPANAKEEKFWLDRSRRIARDCERKHGWLLPYLRTEDSARDMDLIRAALGAKKLNFLGYSWGTSLGMTYATLFPDRVGRMVLDSVSHPSKGWYEGNLDQNKAFQRRIGDFFAWVARHRSVFRLGSTARAVEANYRKVRARLKAKPVKGRIGPSELDELYTLAAYTSSVWPGLAGQLRVLRDKGDTTLFELMYESLVVAEADLYNGYLATTCVDSPWPRDWETWRRDHQASHRVAPFLTWSNAWLNAPCAFWPVEAEEPTPISGDGVPPILMIHSARDAATPYPGALAAHRLFPSSRLIVDKGGDHAPSLNGNKCLDRRVAAYLATGALPASRPGPDLTCAASPAPAPKPAR